MKYLIDTDICIFYFKGKFNIREKVSSVEIANCYVSEITLLELTYGAYNSVQFEKHITEVHSLEKIFEVLAVRPVKEIYAQERKRLKDLGALIPNFDLLIGCTAVHYNMTMVTKNTKHLSRVEGIKVEDWTSKEHNSFIKK